MNKFTKKFKKKAIKLKEKGLHPNKIFKDAGIDISDKKKDYASKLISKWKKSLTFSNEKEAKKRIEYLEAQLAYVKAENEFLKQLPKKK